MPRPLSAADVRGKWHVLKAIVLREMRVRFAGRQLGYLWAVFEPLAHVCILAAVFYVAERVAPVEEGMAIFFGTGIIPWLLFARTVGQVSAAPAANKALLLYPHLYPVDFMLCRMVIESATCMTALILLGLMAFIFTGFIPEDPMGMLTVWFFLTLFSCGFGMTNAVILSAWPSYANVFKAVQRLLFFTSGIFFTAEQLPLQVREFLTWQPLLHMSDMFRSAALPSYDSSFYSLPYIGVVSLGFFLLGLLIERQRRKEMRTP